jgi:hypothetical protein
MKADEGTPGGPFSSNAVRLSIKECLGVVLSLALAGSLLGPVWAKLEAFDPSADYRIPYDLSEDYWLFDRYCEEAGVPGRTLVIGDSFVWGQYVNRDETLSHFLNVESRSNRFVNAGLDGTHPLALEGLIRHHCGSLREGEVVLHLNLLWVSSPQADLQVDPGVGINHPRLVPQFSPSIPGYDASLSDRLGVVMGRTIPLLGWPRHIRSSYFSNADLPHWTLDNPYSNPIRQITYALPEAAADTHRHGQPWVDRGATLQDPPWVDLETSLQWEAFQRLLKLLEARGNSVFILVGPLNEHMLEPTNLTSYRDLLAAVEGKLEDQGVPAFLAPVLPSELYADLSHPLGQGYALMAKEVWDRLSGPSDHLIHPGPAPNRPGGPPRPPVLPRTGSSRR